MRRSSLMAAPTGAIVLATLGGVLFKISGVASAGPTFTMAPVAQPAVVAAVTNCWRVKIEPCDCKMQDSYYCEPVQSGPLRNCVGATPFDCGGGTFCASITATTGCQ